MVFYRKYRPQTINDLDSTSVRETLHAVLQKNIPHAFLFTGPKGLGKTSTARIVAKVVNCTTPKAKRANGLEPCDTCDQCLSITNGTNVDVLEIDAASNRGIDEIRELKEKIRLAPVAAKKKVYIIDEVHMLTTEAFNALLKTLEEPPEHAMFILCTTEAHKVPDTIVSRCFQILFKPATEGELVRSFKRIVKGEKIDIDDEALRYIAQLSNKGFRDGAKILEERFVLSEGKKMTRDSIEEKYQVMAVDDLVVNLLVALKEKKVKEGIIVISELVRLGIDLKYFLTRLLEDLHLDLMTNIGQVDENQVKNIKFSIQEIQMLSKLFSKAYTDMKTSVLPQLPLELAVIEWCSTKQNLSEQNTNQNVIPAEVSDARMGAGISSSGSRIKSGMTNEEVSVTSLRKQVGTMKKLKALYGSPASAQQDAPEDVISVTTATVELLHTSGDGTVTKEWMELFWRSLIDEMKKSNHTVAGVLRGCIIKSYSEQKLVIQTAYKFHKERLDDMKNHESLLNISKLLTGKDIEITIELKK